MIKILRPKRNTCHFANHIFKYIFLSKGWYFDTSQIHKELKHYIILLKSRLEEKDHYLNEMNTSKINLLVPCRHKCIFTTPYQFIIINLSAPMSCSITIKLHQIQPSSTMYIKKCQQAPTVKTDLQYSPWNIHSTVVIMAPFFTDSCDPLGLFFISTSLALGLLSIAEILIREPWR